MRTVTVVGASLAGVSAVSALRTCGYDGRIVAVGDERHAPYDRPPLSKDFLAGSAELADLALMPSDTGDSDSDSGDDLDWRLGVRARELDTDGAAVVLDSGERVPTDGVVVTTGARARTMPVAVPLGVHTLRTLDDALALRAELRPGARLVVIGGGFIGAEVASTARGLGLEVTVVEACAMPLAAQIGSSMAEICAGLHDDHGTRLLCGITVTEFVGTDRVRGVRLSDGQDVPADVVVVGIGSTPNVEWLASAGITDRSGVVVSDAGATSIPAVVAAGDCAATHRPGTDRTMRSEHWSNAQHQPRAAVASLLGVPYQKPASARAPYFWSDQYGHRLQYAGMLDGTGDIEIVEGDPVARDFVAVYRREETPVAVFAMNRAGAFTTWRRALSAGPTRLPATSGR